jgi:hypothetical protein
MRMCSGSRERRLYSKWEKIVEIHSAMETLAGKHRTTNVLILARLNHKYSSDKYSQFNLKALFLFFFSIGYNCKRRNV